MDCQRGNPCVRGLVLLLAFPPPLTGNYIPPLADLSFVGLDDSVYRPTANKISASISLVETSNTPPSNTSVEMPRVESVRPSGVIIKDWVSDDEQDIFQMVTQSPKVDRKDWNGKMTQKLRLGFGFTKKACFVCGSHNHLIKDCDFHEKKMPKESVLRKGTGHKEVRPIWNNTQRINHQNKFVQTAVLTRSGRIPVSIAKQYVNSATLKNRGNPQQALKYKGIFNSGCSRHMTGNKALLTDYQDIDGGFVAFGGNTKGGKITENNILFTETERLVLSPDFKLIDESQVLLRVPRKNNMYSFDLKNVVPSRDLSCLFPKATIDKSKLWHRRLGHVNFKKMNKLMKGNLVRGLPSKTFENDHTCVACQKGKQHKASCKTKLVSSISQPLQMLHMDLFRPTSVRSINHKTYCHVVTDDNSRVLVTKPHNKTPYELIIGRAPSISFMRPFGCPVTILNTLDPLGKFDGKVEEGFLIGYSVNSKAFREFNIETRKVEENLHVKFLENKPNIAGQGPNWLFDIDSLTNSINYQPVFAGNQTNKNAGPQETNGNTGLKKNVNAGQTEEENVSTQQYSVFPLWSSISSSYKSSDDKAKDYTVDDDACRKTAQELASEYDQALKNVLDKMMDQEKEAIDTPVNTTSSSRTFSPVGPSSGPSFVPFGRSFPIDAANLPHDPLMPELEDTAKIQSTGIFGNAYDDHDLETLNTPYADQSVAEKDKSQRFPKLLICFFLSQHEPIKISQALDDESWVEAMQEELLWFKIQKVWTLVDLPSGKKAIGTKWVYINKKDEREIIVRNKAKLVAQGYKQEEGIDYDEVFAPIARVKAIRIFLAFASFMNFLVYQMDVKSAFLYGTIEDEIMHNRFQMSSMGELTFFLGLQVKQKEDGIFISQDKYVGEILKKFGFSSVRTASTPMETNKALTKDEDGEDVDVHLCQPKLGLWYPKDSPLTLEAFSDSDYAGASLDRKSTTGVLWILNQMLDFGLNFMQTKIHVDNESAICVVKNPVYHSKTKHIEIRHHFIRDSYEKRLVKMVKIHIDNNVADLLTKAFNIGVNTARHQLNTASINTTEDGVCAIIATIDGKDKIITEASIRRHLRLQYSKGLTSLLNAEIFEQLTHMGILLSYAWQQTGSLTFQDLYLMP
ncbi:ribonuclease H-like domain-containing protein [Tanacetum coccineum]